MILSIGSKKAKINFTALSCVVCVCILSLITTDASAVILSEGWSSVRALGMGNAYTAVVDNSDALFYNPAALGKIKGFNWTILDPHGGINGLETVQRIQGLTSAGKNTSLSDELSNFYGHPVFAEAGVKTAFTAPGFGLAGYGNSNAAVTLDNPAYPKLNLDYFADYGVALGGAIDLVPEFVQFGLVARRFTRTGTTETLTGAQLANLDMSSLQKELQRTGTAYGVDMGVTFVAPTPLHPTLAFVWKDLGETAFSHDAGIGAPQTIPSQMSVGAGLEIPGPFMTLHPSIEYDYLNRADITPLNKVHLGVELSLPLIDIRAGLNQGYYTAGVGLDLALMRIDVATYGVELGQYPGQQEDRRYVAQVTLEFGFDPGKFSLGGNSQGRLKQRR